jgi:hypothetical protein
VARGSLSSTHSMAVVTLMVRANPAC